MSEQHNEVALHQDVLNDIYSKLNELNVSVNRIQAFMQGVQNIPGAAPACVLHEQRIKACEDAVNRIRIELKDMETKLSRTKITVSIIVAIPTIVIITIKVLEFLGKINP